MPTPVRTELTRPSNTTAYSAKDAISSATSAPADIKFAGIGPGYIVGAHLITDEASLTPIIRIHLFKTAPTQIADNAACTAPLYTNSTTYVGFIDIGPLTSEGTGADSSYEQKTDLRVPVDSDDLYAIVETLNAFTPASAQLFSFVLFIERR